MHSCNNTSWALQHLVFFTKIVRRFVGRWAGGRPKPAEPQNHRIQTVLCLFHLFFCLFNSCALQKCLWGPKWLLHIRNISFAPPPPFLLVCFVRCGSARAFSLFFSSPPQLEAAEILLLVSVSHLFSQHLVWFFVAFLARAPSASCSAIWLGLWFVVGGWGVPPNHANARYCRPALPNTATTGRGTPRPTRPRPDQPFCHR